MMANLTNRVAVAKKRGFPAIILLMAGLWSAMDAARAEAPPFDYLVGTAHHVLPETHDYESGYFSLSEGPDGNIYVGTAKYGVNAFLVQLDPRSGAQRIAIDTHALCGIEAEGMAAQAKIHTRNHVAASGRIYVGSKQGYPTGDDRHTDYRGGYVMRYDTERDEAECLGQIPFLGHGVIDVVADEERNIMYIVTNHDATRGALWLRRPIEGDASDRWQGLYSEPTFYGQTLIDRNGVSHVLSREGRLVSYDPETDALRVRPLEIDEKRFEAPERAPPTWVVAADGATAYLVYMSEPMLYRLDLTSDGDVVALEALGRAIDTDERTDSRCALSIGPDGRVYVAMRRRNDTGFGTGHLHHLVRYDPGAATMTDLGVLAVGNPDYFDFESATTRANGFRKLSDDTLAPDVVHLAMMISRDGDAYVTFLYPFTVLHVPDVIR